LCGKGAVNETVQGPNHADWDLASVVTVEVRDRQAGQLEPSMGARSAPSMAP